jgi:hypothetical protein
MALEANKPCLGCGRSTSTRRGDALYCSAACRQRSYRGRKEAKAAATRRDLEEAKQARNLARERADLIASLIG